MATCPSCAAMIESRAIACWHCGVEIAAASASVVGENAAGAATVPFLDRELNEAETGTRDQPSMLGREILGQYVIVEKLGEGGMGEVYLADQPAIGRRVAIKIVHPQTRASDREEHVERFRNEAKAAAQLESPHIVQIFNWGELADGTLFMAMEYLPGYTLAERLAKDGALAPTLAVAIAEQICTALVEAHAARIIHRDLKPSNIMLSARAGEANFATVLDFGVAKLEGADITRTGAMFGTPQYMSPEQLRGESLDGRSDLYAVGVMLYEMLSGVLPFSSATAVGYVTAHLHDQPPPLPPTVPGELAEVVLMFLSKDPRERPADASAAITELRAALGGRSPAARKRVRQRALRRTVRRATTVGAVVLIAALGFASWRVWEWRLATQAELDREREHGANLERKVRETEAAAALARDEARAAALQARQASDEVHERRMKVQRSRPTTPASSSAKRTPVVRSRAQLEADLREVFDERRVPPSEIADVWKTHESRVAAVAAGEIDELELREQLVSMISLYRQGFASKRPGDRLPLDRLEQLFLAIRTKTELDVDQRQAMLDAIYDEYDHDDALPDVDRDYYKRLAVAGLIRDHGADASTTVPVDGVVPPLASETEGEPLPSGEPDAIPAPTLPLPSLDGP